nr:hypothetical protein Iba_chr02dCG3090 [Ipomoea batatas]
MLPTSSPTDEFDQFAHRRSCCRRGLRLPCDSRRPVRPPPLPPACRVQTTANQ